MNDCNNIIERLYEKIEAARTELLIKTLVEKGYLELAENIREKRWRRFMGIYVEQNGGWFHYWADNGTEQGDFIISMRIDLGGDNWKVENDGLNFKVSPSVEYSTTPPLQKPRPYTNTYLSSNECQY